VVPRGRGDFSHHFKTIRKVRVSAAPRVQAVAVDYRLPMAGQVLAVTSTDPVAQAMGALVQMAAGMAAEGTGVLIQMAVGMAVEGMAAAAGVTVTIQLATPLIQALAAAGIFGSRRRRRRGGRATASP
jgi:hypothetical protein